MRKKSVIVFVQVWFLSFTFFPEIIMQEFSNPTSGQTIVYKGEDYRGQGTFYLKRNDQLVPIVTTKIRYGPMVNWFGNEIAEIFIPHGSPFNSSYLYNTKTMELSGMLDNVITVLPQDDIVVFTDWERFYFSRISSQEILQEVFIEGIASSYMALRQHFNIILEKETIRIGVDYEPGTYIDLETFMYYEFERKF